MISIDRLVRAVWLSADGHKNQRRDHGIPYFNHTAQVADKVADYLCNDTVSLAAAYCHDLLEDTSVTEYQIKEAIGGEALELVKQLTNDYPDNLEHDEKMLAVAKHAKEITDPRAQLIKLCDRLCNLRECEAWKPKRIAKYILNTEILLKNLTLDCTSFRGHFDDLRELIKEELDVLIKIEMVQGHLTELTGVT